MHFVTIALISLVQHGAGFQFFNVPKSLIKILASSKGTQTVSFSLFTRKNSEKPIILPPVDEKRLKQAGFDKSKWTYILAAGWNSQAFEPWVVDIKSALLDRTKCNVIVVDWTACAMNYNYVEVIETCMLKSSQAIALLINNLKEIGVSIRKIHMIGHSLGSHLVGGVASFDIHVKRITGLDPAIFNIALVRLPFSRLNKTKADFVDVIHTSRVLGSADLHGHADFFVNGALKQPGCQPFLKSTEIKRNELFETYCTKRGFGCDHTKATEYFAESIKHPKKFPALKCASLLDAVIGGNCLNSSVYMEFPANTTNKGIFYVSTKWKKTAVTREKNLSPFFIDRALQMLDDILIS